MTVKSPVKILAYHRVPPRTFAYHEGFEFWVKVPEIALSGRVPPRTSAYLRVPSRTFAYQRAVLLMKVRRPTLIIARRTPTDPKTALAGVLLETSFARLKTSMNPFNAEIVPSRSLGCWDSVSIGRRAAWRLGGRLQTRTAISAGFITICCVQT